MNLHDAFEEFNDDYIRFERVPEAEKLHAWPDLCAFLYLFRLLPRPGRDLVCAAEHDVIWLDVDCDEFARVATGAIF